MVAQVVETALRGGHSLVRPWAGIRGQTVTADLARNLGLPRPGGVIIAAIHALSPLRAAGLKVGDVIVALAGQPVATPEEFSFRLAALGVGGSAEIDFFRRGQPATAMVDLVPEPRK
jgi:S1-C subfamily serine protease